MRGVEVGIPTPGSIGNVYSSKLNIKIPGYKNYNYNVMSPPPASTRGAITSAHGTPNYNKQQRRGV